LQHGRSDIVKKLRPANCQLDSITAHLFKDVFNTVRPSALSMINTSLCSGVVLAAFKHAVVQPLLKKKKKKN